MHYTSYTHTRTYTRAHTYVYVNVCVMCNTYEYINCSHIYKIMLIHMYTCIYIFQYWFISFVRIHTHAHTYVRIFFPIFIYQFYLHLYIYQYCSYSHIYSVIVDTKCLEFERIPGPWKVSKDSNLGYSFLQGLDLLACVLDQCEPSRPLD